jgi:preprotein translocase subunit SecA
VPAFAGESEMALEGAGSMAVAATLPMRSDAVDPNDPTTWHNASRNAPCPCGSGKKYKHCHGRLG